MPHPSNPQRVQRVLVGEKWNICNYMYAIINMVQPKVYHDFLQAASAEWVPISNRVFKVAASETQWSSDPAEQAWNQIITITLMVMQYQWCKFLESRRKTGNATDRRICLGHNWAQRGAQALHVCLQKSNQIAWKIKPSPSLQLHLLCLLRFASRAAKRSARRVLASKWVKIYIYIDRYSPQKRMNFAKQNHQYKISGVRAQGCCQDVRDSSFKLGDLKKENDRKWSDSAAKIGTFAPQAGLSELHIMNDSPA